MSISQKVLDAIEILTDNSIKKAQYDKTIQAQILSCEDATIGKYRCRYQDAVFYAYSNNSEMTFTNGSQVYILVPGNDMSKQKTILGSTKKLGINYISQVQGDEAYDLIGNNCIISDNKFYLDSNNQDYKYILYSVNQSENNVDLDIQSLEYYIKQSSSLIVGATFKTSIPAERQYRGHYGITYNLRFIDNTSNQDVIRSYTIDEDNMINNPYRLIYETRQYQIFDIDGINFKQIQSIQIFNKNFPNAIGTNKNKKIQPNLETKNWDIEITKLELSGAVRMSQSEINGVAISFYTPQGTFFNDYSNQKSNKTITAQVRVKGKLVSAVQNIPFYWGRERVNVFANSEYYNKYLGRGWQCLNDKNVIVEATENTEPVIEWIPGKDTFILNYTEATARDNKFKVAIFYDGNVITKQINIQNLAINTPELNIESSGGTKFYYDIGHPTLTCLVNGGEPINYKYYWAYEDNNGNFKDLPETSDLNSQYNTIFNELKDLQNDIAAGKKFANAQDNNLSNLKGQLQEFNYIQRVQNNKIYDVQINNITNFGKFKCSVFNNKDIYLGTTSITLTNTLDGQDIYSLIINNGSAIFQYNENGVAPNNKSLDVPQEIQGLSFTLYDNLGQPIDNNILLKSSDCKIRWAIPIKDTMLVKQNINGESSGIDATLTYQYYDNITNFIYNIAQQYNIKKQRNQIKLTVDYKGMNLTAETQFTFAKQGEPGTNGTDYVVKLIPNTKMDSPPLWPMITYAGTKYFLNYGLNSKEKESNIGTSSSYQFFKAQLWHSGELVWQGFEANTAAKDGITKPSLISWEILANKYNTSISDISIFSVSNASKGFIKLSNYTKGNIDTVAYANIIKCSITFEGKTYYGTIPFTVAWTSNEKYRIGLKDYTGFRYVIYSSDGITPQYDSSYPFEFICTEKINGKNEDVSLVVGSHAITYEPNAVGNYHETKYNGNIIQAKLLTLLNQDFYRDELNKNQWQYKPASKYDGLCVNAAVTCVYKNNGVIIGKINIPIHFLLNKYGLSHINAWDGNSVQIDSEGGFILSPQMGAGTKNSSNQFTGVLMGEVRNAGKSKSDIGLLGYSKGDRTFFLNSENGSAIFGKAGGGQIVINPNQTQALLYSGDYYTNYDENGLPNNISSGKGLLINLSKPQIRYGNGNFSVNEKGFITAQGGGSIGGWILSNDKDNQYLRSPDKTIYLNSTKSSINLITQGNLYANIHSNKHSTLTTAADGFYLSEQGLSINNRFKVDGKTGTVYIGSYATQRGGIESGPYWTIDGNGSKSYIAYDGNSWNDANPNAEKTKEETKNPAKVYIGTDGISLGGRFSVNTYGDISARGGLIGGWQIGAQRLFSGVADKETGLISKDNVRIQLNADGSMFGGQKSATMEDGTKKVDATWRINSTGQAIFNRIVANNSGSIAGWIFKKATVATQKSWMEKYATWKNQNLVKTVDGKKGSEIIDMCYLQSGNLKLYSSGSIVGKNWWIDADGVANFSDVKGITVKNSFNFSGASGVLGKGIGSSGGQGYINPTNTMSSKGGSTTLQASIITAAQAKFDTLYAKQADFDNLNVMNKLKYGKLSAGWVNTTVVTNISTRDVTINGITFSAVKSYSFLKLFLLGGKIT